MPVSELRLATRAFSDDSASFRADAQDFATLSIVCDVMLASFGQRLEGRVHRYHYVARLQSLSGQLETFQYRKEILFEMLGLELERVEQQKPATRPRRD